jgi:hypothetical protein
VGFASGAGREVLEERLGIENPIPIESDNESYVMKRFAQKDGSVPVILSLTNDSTHH